MVIYFIFIGFWFFLIIVSYFLFAVFKFFTGCVGFSVGLS
ncbi:hypothetical protein N402_08225 [Helicobacter pylori FD423]|nr:hypothetical protein N402_08225 [Helicobacter pylori FD423]